MMPGALTSTRARFAVVDRALAVDRVAERVDDAAEELLADRNVDDRAGALDRLAFLDLAVGAENDDADIVRLEVERHPARAVLELDHLAGLHLVEAVGAGDAVADTEHLTDFGHLRLGTEIGDLAFEDRRNFCGADIHQPTSFMAKRIALSLVFSEPSTMREPSLTIRPPTIDGSSLDVEIDLAAARGGPQLVLERRELGVGERGRARDFGVRHAAVRVVELAIVRDHLADEEQAALDVTRRTKFAAMPVMSAPAQDRVERLELIVGGEHRTSDEPLEIGAFGDERVEARQSVRDLLGLALVLGEGKQRGRIAAGDAGNEGFFLCQARDLRRRSKRTRAALERRQPRNS